MPNFKRVFSSLGRRNSARNSAPPVGQQPHPFDSPQSTPVSLRHIPLHIQVTVQTRRLPVLPPEVWLQIFRFATEDDTRFTPIDFPAKTSDTNEISFLHFPHPHSDTDVRLEYYLRSIKRKHDILKVCKQWSIIGLEVLYETIWIFKPAQAHTLAKALSCETDEDACSIHDPQKGHYIKRLHIETPVRERCSPSDLRIIIDNAPCLEIYTDYRSVRTSVYASSSSDPASPLQLLYALTHADSVLRRLSWTNYDDMSFHLRLFPLLSNIAANLEYLELTFCNMDIHNLREPLRGDPGPSLTLPSLLALKVCLHDATLAVLATWDLPVIKNVSIVAADFSYAGEGFSNFFRKHGGKLNQIELAHSSSIIEDHYLTIPVDPPTATSRNVHLAAWCPNLREFICSADAEWNWQNPDWIAPHALLLSHPNLQLIGVRDLDKRIYDEMSMNRANPFFLLLSQIESLLRRESFPQLLYIRDMSFESKLMRTEALSESVLNFWSQVVRCCKDGGAWLEDYTGMNVTPKDIVRSQVKVLMRTRAKEAQRELERQRRNPLHHLMS